MGFLMPWGLGVDRSFEAWRSSSERCARSPTPQERKPGKNRVGGFEDILLDGIAFLGSDTAFNWR